MERNASGGGGGRAAAVLGGVDVAVSLRRGRLSLDQRTEWLSRVFPADAGRRARGVFGRAGLPCGGADRARVSVVASAGPREQAFRFRAFGSCLC